MSIIKIDHLKKSYNNFEAVKDISFTVNEGQFFAFLGENGAGKSTTINIIATLLAKSSGQVTVNHHLLDQDDAAIRKSIGVVFQNNLLDDFLTVKENIYTRGQLYGLNKKAITKQFDNLVLSLDAADIINKRYGKLSGGQRRKADIMRALIHQPKILILDEPTTGLDPSTRKKVWHTLSKIRKEENITLFLTTHYMEEAAEADYIVILDHGKIAASGTPASLRINHSFDRLILLPKDMNTTIDSLEPLQLDYSVGTDKITIPLKHSLDAIDIISPIKHSLKGFEVLGGTMDDAFINIINKEVVYE